MEMILKKIYLDPANPGGYSSVEKLLLEARKKIPNITRTQVKNFLESNMIYTLHKARRLKFRREQTVPSGYMTDVQVDLGDFQKIAKENNGYRYLLVAVDVLSRRVFIAPTMSKTFAHMKIAFDQLFKEMPILPHRIFSDKGLEFECKEIKKYFEEKQIQKHRATFSMIKAAHAERSLRTIKQRLYRYFTAKKTLNWVNVIQKIGHAINHSVNRVTKMRPADVNFSNAQKLWKFLYASSFLNQKAKTLKKGDAVRIAKEKGVFTKGYLPSFTDHIYKIDDVKQGHPVTYRLVDPDKKTEIKGKHYNQELVKTTLSDDTNFRIEKVYNTRVVNGSKQFFVKFVDYPDLEWIRADSIV